MQFPVSNNFTVVVKILKMLINNCGKKKKRQANWDKTTYFYINWWKSCCVHLATENLQRRTRLYECLDHIKSLMDGMDVPSFHAKIKAETGLSTVGRTIHKRWNSGQWARRFCFHSSFCSFPGNSDYFFLELRAW